MANVDVEKLEHELNSLHDQLDQRLKNLNFLRSAPTENPDWPNKIEREENEIADLRKQIDQMEKVLETTRQSQRQATESFAQSSQYEAPQGPLAEKASLKAEEILLPDQDDADGLADLLSTESTDQAAGEEDQAPAADTPSNIAQVEDKLKTLFAAIGPGKQLPSEPELAQELGVRRSTLREALHSLKDQGLVTSTPGVGTFYTPEDSGREEGSTAADRGPADSELWAQYTAENGPASRWDPVILGVGVGSAPQYAVTLTALVTDENGHPYLLVPGAELRENPSLLQPAPIDGGRPEDDQVGELSQLALNPRCDAALISIEGQREIQSLLPDGSFVTDTAEPQLGMRVHKYGRSTGRTYGYVSLVSMTVEISYADRNRRFENFIAVSADRTLTDSTGTVSTQTNDLMAPRINSISNGGDRGALLLDEENRAVGMIIAHSSNITVAVPINTVLKELKVTLVNQPASAIRQERAADDLAAINDQVKGMPDKLNFSEYVDAFVRLIYDPATRPPLAIGIYGAWGVGKSFLMNKIEQALRECMQADVQKLSWSQKLLRLSPDSLPIISFNAWAYNASEKLWAGLMQEIFRGVEKSGLGWRGKLELNLRRNLERQWKSFKAKLLPYTLIATVVAIFALAFVLNNQQKLAAALLTPVGLAALFSALKELVGLFSTPASDRIVELFEGPDYSKEMGFMDRIRTDLEDLASSLPAGMKVVVFIDDLDRCEPEKAVEVLEAVKLILDIDRFIVFLGVDTRVVTEAVEQHYGKVLAEAGITGYEYLNKIVQIPFSIPRPNPNEISNYLGHLMGMEEDAVQELREKATRPAAVLQKQRTEPVSKAEPSSTDQADESAEENDDQPAPIPITDTEDKRAFRTFVFEDFQPFTEAEQTAFITLADHLVTNPRRLKRLVNVYRLVRSLASNRGVELIHQRPQDVLLWLVLCEQWPYLTHLMLEEIDQRLDKVQTTQELESVLDSHLPSLHAAAKKLVDTQGNSRLTQLDQDYQELETLVTSFGNGLSISEIRQLQPFTINFNPALTAEVQRSLASPK